MAHRAERAAPSQAMRMAAARISSSRGLLLARTSAAFRIVARGNAYTGGTRIQDFVLLKAAETTKAAGGTHFIIGASQDASRQGAIVTPATSQTTFVGRSAYTTFM